MSTTDPITMAKMHTKFVQKEARSAILAAENAITVAYESDAECEEVCAGQGGRALAED